MAARDQVESAVLAATAAQALRVAVCRPEMAWALVLAVELTIRHPQREATVAQVRLRSAIDKALSVAKGIQ